MNELMNYVSGWWAGLSDVAQMLGGVGILLTVGLVADFIVRPLLIRLMRRLAGRSRHHWDDVLVRYKFFSRLAQTIPTLVLYMGISYVPGLPEPVIQLIRNVALAYLAMVITLTVSALLSTANAIYSTYPIARERPIKGFVQVVQILVYVLGGVFIVSALLARSPVVLLTGFGAMTAIVLLVFKDTILSLVASIQLTSLNMVRVGDWIEIPDYNADGDVIDVALHTVTVQNWDKTITTIPTHKLITESFKNWRGMSESGGRRIKRSINIDVGSVRFLTEEEVEKFSRFALLRDYIARKKKELAEYNVGLEGPDTANVNLRRLTNIGTFRAYLWNYLSNHPQIHRDMTLLVRQLEPGDSGMPMELYCFTRSTDWEVYEDVQADIFDHILAQCGEFGLKVFQVPSGADVTALGDVVKS